MCLQHAFFLTLIPNFPRYDPKTDAWTTVAPLSVARDAVGICPLGDRLYAVGGYDGHSYLDTVESYDAQNNEWTEVKGAQVMPQKLQGFSQQRGIILSK